jgi:phosphomannomutase/phosphoglucomutase
MPIVPSDIFLSSCIRGLVRQTLTPEVCKQIGLALGSEARAQGFSKMVVGRDGRLLSQDYATSLMTGLNDAGIDVFDLTLVPIGVVQTMAHELADGCGVMVTAGRSPAAWGGFKPMLGGVPMSGEALQALQRRIEAQDFVKGAGEFDRDNHVEDYIARIVADVKLARPVKVVLDYGNGATAVLATELFTQLGCTVHEIWPQVDGNFPNHFPDPTVPDNLVDVVSVQRSSAQGEVGIVFSCDGAGMGVVDMRGYAVEPDRVLMLLAADLLAAQPGAMVLADTRSSERVQAFVQGKGGQFGLAPVGHALVDQALHAQGAQLAGDLAGHYFFADRWHGHDDALYAAARLVQAISRFPDGASAAAALAALPKAQAPAEIRIKAEPEVALGLVGALADQPFEGGTLTRLDTPQGLQGLRVVWPEALCVARAATSMPGLSLRFEGANPAALRLAQEQFKGAFSVVRPGVALPF